MTHPEGHEQVTVREACKRRWPLGGADAQALEGALQQAERECDALKADLAQARAHIEELERERTAMLTTLAELTLRQEG